MGAGSDGSWHHSAIMDGHTRNKLGVQTGNGRYRPADIDQLLIDMRHCGKVLKSEEGWF